MSTIITTRLERRVEADPSGMTVTDTTDGQSIMVALTRAQAGELAAALDPGRDFSGVDWKAMYEQAIRERDAAGAGFPAMVQRLELSERERDEALRKKGEAFDRAVRAERERDEWKARAEALEAEAEEAFEQGATWQKARTAPTVTRDDIDRALINVTSNAMNYPTPSQMLGKDTGPLRRKCVDAVCALFGIEAGQATDPVEAKARELWNVVHADDGVEWEQAVSHVHERYFRLARHVLGMEADQ